MSNIKYNVSKTYLLPLISELVYINPKFIDYLENTFMFVEGEEFNDQRYFAILHKFNFKNPEFTAYEHKLIDNELFVKHIDINDMVLYIFKFPEEYHKEYDLLYDSKFSKFGEDAKRLILDFWTKMYGRIPAGINAILKIKQILYKDKKLKQELETKLSSNYNRVIIKEEQELGELLNVDNETFRIDEYKN